jgi:hypothetical protein
VDVLDWFGGEAGLLSTHEIRVDERFALDFAPDDY